MPRKYDKEGWPNARDCTCKNKQCRHRFIISIEDPRCDKCDTTHCPDCLKIVSGYICPNCEYEVYEDESGCPWM